MKTLIPPFVAIAIAALLSLYAAPAMADASDLFTPDQQGPVKNQPLPKH